MLNFITDIWSMITSLSFIDYILYFAVITLIMLIVALLYVIKEEQLEKKEQITEIELPKKIKEEEKNSEEEIDLQTIIQTIDENPEPVIDMTAYEEEQEKKAIISYDELIQSAQNTINYDKEVMVDDLIPVKKISINPTDNVPIEFLPKEPKVEIELPKENSVNLFSYEKEEEFLKTLQKLNELLN